MSERIFECETVIDDERVLTHREGFKMSVTDCLVLVEGKCPFQQLKHCGRCTRAQRSHESLLEALSNNPNLIKSGEVKSRDNRLISTTFFFRNGTEISIVHERGDVILTRKNP